MLRLYNALNVSNSEAVFEKRILKILKNQKMLNEE